MAHMGDVCAACGMYDGQDGQAKTRFVRVGAWFENDQGALSVKLDALPLQDSKGECWLKLFPKKDDQQSEPPPRQQQQQAPRQQQSRRGGY
jgi:hypothetical protein